MKRAVTGVIVLLLLLTTVIGCDNPKDSSQDLNLDEIPDKVVIIYLANATEFPPVQAEGNSVEILDMVRIEEVVYLYQTMRYSETSRPMEFPRFFVQFFKGEKAIADFSVAQNSTENDDRIIIVSGSEIGLGNKVLESDVLLESISDIYANP